MASSQTQVPVSIDKLKACILYVCSKEKADHANLDHIKLNKVLWYSDTAAYMETGKSITGGRYVRKPHGPVAKFMAPATRLLIEEEAIAAGKRFDTGRGMWLDTYEVIGTAEGVPDLSDADRKYLDAAFNGACVAMDSASVSQRTHGDIWEIASNGEDIPLFAMYAESPGRITSDHINAAFGR